MASTDNSKVYTALGTSDPETGEAEGVFVGFSDEPPSGASSGEQPHLYFLNCCCDFRRAVLVFNGITIILRLFLMIALAVIASYVVNHVDEVEAAMDDDEAKQALETAVDSGMVPLLEAVLDVLWGVGIVFAGIAVYGALQFKRWAIVTALWFYGVCLVITILALDVPDTLFYGLAVYAHWHMNKLMKAEIMTDENYHNIASCCGK